MGRCNFKSTHNFDFMMIKYFRLFNFQVEDVLLPSLLHLFVFNRFLAILPLGYWW